jgi:mono/diheme cytochrome c family protein
MLRTVFITLCVAACALLLAAAAVVYSGVYPVSATRQHFQSVYALLEITMRQSVRLSARDVAVPPLDGAEQLRRGAACFRDKCVVCHGAPGVAQGEIGQGMQPLPGPLVDARQRWAPRELYWIVKHGIRMSGMPAWEFRMSDGDLWSLVAFMQQLPDLSPEAYAKVTQTSYTVAAGPAVTTCGFSPAERDAPVARGADVQRGRTALSQYACSACHTIPGVTSSSPQVGPPLSGMARRGLIAGRLSNTRENMVTWLRAPQKVDPHTAMPDLRVTEADARDIAAYLETLH